MDERSFSQIVIGLIGILVSILGWNFRTQKAEHDKLKTDHHRLVEDHAAHRLSVSENYAKKTDLNAARLEVSDSVRRLHEKVESVDANLDRKISEMPEKIAFLLNHRPKG